MAKLTAFTLSLLLLLQGGYTRKLLQGAGAGAGCDSILTQADNGSGYTVEDAENTLAGDVGGAGKGRRLHQGAGAGAGCNSILTEADNGSGYTVEDTENTLAGDVGGVKAIGKKLLTVDASQGRSLKQANKVADGANNLITALGDPQLGQTVGTVGDQYDDQGTNDAAALGQEVGNAEAALPEATGAIPGRKLRTARGLKQANKVADGANNLITALGDPQLGQTVGTVGDQYDDQGTNDAAALGQEVGNAEAALPEATGAIPGKK